MLSNITAKLKRRKEAFMSISSTIFLFVAFLSESIAINKEVLLWEYFMNSQSILNLLLLYFFIVLVFIVVNEVKDCSKGLFKLFQNDLIFRNTEIA